MSVYGHTIQNNFTVAYIQHAHILYTVIEYFDYKLIVLPR